MREEGDSVDETGGSGDDAGDEAVPEERERGERADRRHERLERHPTPGRGNSLQSWTRAKSPLTVVRNYLVVSVARVSPSLRLKNALLRRIGVTVGRGVSWGLESTPDVFWPERITVGDDAIVGYDATILCHEFLQNEYRLGDVEIGERAMIGAGAVLLPGVRVGADAQVAANSLVAEDVPPGATVAGVPAKPLSRGESEGGGERRSRDESI